MEIRLAQHLPDDSGWRCFLCQRGNLSRGLRGGMQINFGQGLTGTVYDHDQNIPDSGSSASKSGTELIDLLYRRTTNRYEYVSTWDLTTTRLREPGSAEMPSGRAFTWKLLLSAVVLKRRTYRFILVFPLHG